MEDLMSPDTLKLSEVDIGETLQDLGTGITFLNRTLRARKHQQESTNNSTSSIASAQKETIHRVKRQPTEWRPSLLAIPLTED